jgi:anti-sigma factor RsiW
MEHLRELLQDAVDRRLDPAKQAEVEAHLALCPACRRELEALSWVKRSAASVTAPLPPGFERRLRDSLEREDRSRRSRRREAAALLAAAAAIALAVGLSGFWRKPVPARLAQDLWDFRSGTLVLGSVSESPAELEAYFASGALPFPMRVFDLAMMGYRLEGAAVRPLANAPGALVAYRGPGGRLLLCRMYRGRIEELPAPSETRENAGIGFQVYREGELTLVFWQEGDVVCVLVGDGEPEAVIALAFAKAVRV